MSTHEKVIMALAAVVNEIAHHVYLILLTEGRYSVTESPISVVHQPGVTLFVHAPSLTEVACIRVSFPKADALAFVAKVEAFRLARLNIASGAWERIEEASFDGA